MVNGDGRKSNQNAGRDGRTVEMEKKGLWVGDGLQLHGGGDGDLRTAATVVCRERRGSILLERSSGLKSMCGFEVKLLRCPCHIGWYMSGTNKRVSMHIFPC